MSAILLESAVRSCALAFLAWLLLTLARVRNPRLQRIAWLTVLLAAVAMPALMRFATLPIVTAPALLSWSGIETIVFAGPDRAPRSAWAVVLPGIYLAVTLLLAGRYAYALARLWLIRRRAVRLDVVTACAVQVRATTDFGSPVTIGSTILVPADFARWDSVMQRAVIAHERMHVKNGDFYVQLLAQLHRIVFWFSPLAWWLPSRLTMLSEELSDDAAIDEIQERVSYAEILLGVATDKRVPRNAVAMARCATVARRVERILAQASISQRPGWQRVCGLLAVLFACVLACAGLTTIARQAVAADAPALPAPAAQGALVMVAPRSNPATPLSQPPYPSLSRRLGEQGTVVMQLYVLSDGSVANADLVKSSGYLDLDNAALSNAYNWLLEPGTINGKATAMWGRFAVTFKLSD